MSLVQVNKVNFQYDNQQTVLKDICFSIEKGEKIGLIGSNGVGKTTLMKMLVGLLFPGSGSVMVDNLILNKKNLKEIREKIGYVFQDADSQLFMSTVYDDIAFGPRNYGYSEEEVKQRVEEAMEAVGCSYLRDKAIYKMSGGEKKLVSLATILALKPEMMIMDEPTIALDPGNRRKLINILNELSCTLLIASHDLDMVMDVCERVLLMHDGKIVREGKTEEILSDKALLESCGLELPLRLQI